jgi:CRISPR-associated protein Csb2
LRHPIPVKFDYVLTIRISYTPGVFHEAPWIRAAAHAVEWPPSPFTLLGILVAGWSRIRDGDVGRLQRIVDALAAIPTFDLPPATLGHKRHHTRDTDSNSLQAIDTSPLLDAFGASSSSKEPAVSTYVTWRDVDLDPDDLGLLDQILAAAHHINRTPCSFSLATMLPTERDRIRVIVASADDPHDGPLVRRIAAHPSLRGAALFKALLRDATGPANPGRAQPNETILVDYRFPPQFGLDVQDVFARERARSELPPRIERFALSASSGYRVPLVTETIVLAEAMRWATMRASSARELRTADPVLSGKAPGGQPAQGHRHAFFLPRDLDGDGRLDHLDVWYPTGSSVETHRASLATKTLYDHRMNCRVHVNHVGHAERTSGLRWQSVTPFVLERHVKTAGRASSEIKSGAPIDQVRASLRNHGIATPPAEIEIHEGRALARTPDGKSMPPFSFRRARLRESRAMPAYAVELRFDVPVEGPIVAGKHAHFGLGQFVPLA